MLLRQIVAVLATVSLVTGQNSTDDLDVRVTILEEDVSDLESDVVELRTDNTLQDERLNIMEEAVLENVNDIDDLDATVNESEETIVLLQQSVATLEEMNNLLLERVDALEAALETSNQQIIELQSTTNDLEITTNALESVTNTTAECVESLEADVQSMDIRLVRVEEEGADHEIQITDLEESDSDQNDRMTIIENSVDDWDDRIVALEALNDDVQDRLVVLEEAVIVPWVACTSSPCGNGATCIDVNVDTFICACRDGYYGETCQNTPTEACSSSPCENGGTCHDVNVEKFLCSCRDGYFGSTCGESYADTSFLASVDHDPGTPPEPIVFNVARINPGGHYDITSGIYTVPVDGIYEFMVHIWTIDDPTWNVYVEVDDVQIFGGYAREGIYNDPYMDLSVMLSLTAGQQVWALGTSMTGMLGDAGTVMRSWFSGHLIHAY